jgi:hypothetical protein
MCRSMYVCTWSTKTVISDCRRYEYCFEVAQYVWKQKKFISNWKQTNKKERVDQICNSLLGTLWQMQKNKSRTVWSMIYSSITVDCTFFIIRQNLLETHPRQWYKKDKLDSMTKHIEELELYLQNFGYDRQTMSDYHGTDILLDRLYIYPSIEFSVC